MADQVSGRKRDLMVCDVKDDRLTRSVAQALNALITDSKNRNSGCPYCADTQGKIYKRTCVFPYELKNKPLFDFQPRLYEYTLMASIGADLLYAMAMTSN